MRHLRRIRAVVALAFLAPAVLMFLDFGRLLPARLAALVARLQLVPSIVALPALGAALAVGIVTAVTLVTGRVYCSTICPLGTVQDALVRLGDRGRRRGRYRFRFLPPRPWLHLAVAGAAAALALAGSMLALDLIEPYSAFGRILETALARWHGGARDFAVVVPQELIRKEQRTQRVFQMVMGGIAGISLLVGGIGIANILFASVVERTSEIGLRRAVGARQFDITAQFLFEAMVSGAAGGLIGTGPGVGNRACRPNRDTTVAHHTTSHQCRKLFDRSDHGRFPFFPERIRQEPRYLNSRNACPVQMVKKRGAQLSVTGCGEFSMILLRKIKYCL